MPRTRLLPLLIFLLFMAPSTPLSPSGASGTAASARSSWFGPVQLTNSTNGSWDPSIYVDDSGVVHLAWQDGTDRTSIRYKSFAPSGEVLVNDTVLVNYNDAQPPIYVSGRPYAPRLDFNDGELVLFWNDTENHPSGQTDHDEGLGMLRFSPDLKSRTNCWLPIYAIDRLYYGNPLYAFDSSGNIHFAYAGNLQVNADPDVWYVKTNATGGKRFSKYLARNGTEVGVAVDKWDNVHLVWRNETGNLTYSRLDKNGTETCRIDQIPGTNSTISTFTIVAKDMSAGANIYWNEMSDIYMCSIFPNGTTKTGFLFSGHQQGGLLFYYDGVTPLMARSDGTGSNLIFGYGHPNFQPDPNFPYYIVQGGTGEDGAGSPAREAIEGMNLFDYGYRDIGPPFSPFVSGPGHSGRYVAYSNDRLTWQDPAGGINIYLKQLGSSSSDLSVREIGFSDSSPLEQDNISIRIKVGYNGTGYVTVFDLAMFLDGAELASGNWSLGPDNTSTVLLYWTATTGMHNFSANISSGFTDLNISNNRLNASLYVAGRPDISVEGIDWDPPDPVVGDRVDISAHLANAGESAGNFTWGIELAGSGLANGSTRLGPGEHGNFPANWTPDLPGNYSIRALANGTEPYELELGNNSLGRTIHVSNAPFGVEILSPANGSRVSGVVVVSGRVIGMWGTSFLDVALGNASPRQVQIFSDGGWSLTWVTLNVPNGIYDINASAGNGWANAAASIQVVVDNPVPQVLFSPAGDIVINESGVPFFESQIVWAVPIDAVFNWTVNGIEIPGPGVSWANGMFWLNTSHSFNGELSRLTFFTNWSSSGKYLVKVVLRYFHFEQVEASCSWNLTVKNVNTAPVIMNFSRPANLTARQNSNLTFWVEVFDAEGDGLAYAWFVDGQQDPQSSSVFCYPATGKAGTRQVKVAVSDGEFRVAHNWTVTVPPKKEVAAGEVVWWPWAAVAVLCAVTATGLWAARRLRRPPRSG